MLSVLGETKDPLWIATHISDIETMRSNISNNIDWWHSHLSFHVKRDSKDLFFAFTLEFTVKRPHIRAHNRACRKRISVYLILHASAVFQSYPQRLTVMWQTDAVDMHTVKEWMQWTYWNIYSRMRTTFKCKCHQSKWLLMVLLIVSIY